MQPAKTVCSFSGFGQPTLAVRPGSLGGECDLKVAAAKTLQSQFHRGMSHRGQNQECSGLGRGRKQISIWVRLRVGTGRLLREPA
jgi:hypothetical protein